MKENNKTTMNAQARTAYEPVSVRVVKVTPQGVLCASSPLDPENPEHHWRYRVHLDISELAENPEFCTSVASVIKDSGR